MKKVIKSVIALAMAAVMVMALAACSGSAKDKRRATGFTKLSQAIL